MTPREKALEAALREIIPQMTPETKGDELFLHELHKLLNQSEPEWLPTPLAACIALLRAIEARDNGEVK